MTSSVVVDVAGAREGGAARFLGELRAFLEREPHSARLVGEGRMLTASWLVARERQAQGAMRRIALNNASFAGGGGQRIVLLRNALHFASHQEIGELGYRMPRGMRMQIPLVRALARRADQVIVPCTAMRDRVVGFVPSLAGRVVVRPHPVSLRGWAGTPAPNRQLLVPILNAPYKRLDLHLRQVQAVAQSAGVERIVVTADASDFPADVALDNRFTFIGRVAAEDLEGYWAASRAVYFPTQLEAFGYPLAEARANGRRVVALNTDQNREIAGQALAGFYANETDSLERALHDAMQVAVAADPGPCDPGSYFEWLLRGGE